MMKETRKTQKILVLALILSILGCFIFKSNYALLSLLFIIVISIISGILFFILTAELTRQHNLTKSEEIKLGIISGFKISASLMILVFSMVISVVKIMRFLIFKEPFWRLLLFILQFFLLILLKHLVLQLVLIHLNWFCQVHERYLQIANCIDPFGLPLVFCPLYFP